MAGYTEPSHSYKVKIQSLEDEKREDEGTRKKEKRGKKRRDGQILAVEVCGQ